MLAKSSAKLKQGTPNWKEKLQLSDGLARGFTCTYTELNSRSALTIDPETVDKGEIDPQPDLAEQPVQPDQDDPNPSASQPAADTGEAPSSPLPSVASRPVRARQAPAWMQD